MTNPDLRTRVMNLLAHYEAQRNRATDAGDAYGAKLMHLILNDLNTIIFLNPEPSHAKV